MKRTPPSYFVNSMVQEGRKNAQSREGRSKTKDKKQKTDRYTSHAEIAKMKKDLEMLAMHSKIQQSQLVTVSPIVAKKHKPNETIKAPAADLNEKLDRLIRRLEEMKENEGLTQSKQSKEMSRIIKKNNWKNNTSQRYSSRSATSRNQHKYPETELQSKELPSRQLPSNDLQPFQKYSNKVSKSIFLLSDVSQQGNQNMNHSVNYANRNNSAKSVNSSQVSNPSGPFFNNLIEVNSHQTSQRIPIPTSRQTKPGGTASIQYYLMQEKLYKNEPLGLEFVGQLKPHRAKISAIVNTTQMFTASYDYTVCRIYQEQSEVMQKHRAPVECLINMGDIIISGGRDCYIKCRDWSRKLPSMVKYLCRLSENRMAIGSDKFYIFDLEKQHINEREKMNPKMQLISTDINNACYISQGSQLFLYDTRHHRNELFLNVNDNVDLWWRGGGKIMAVGQKYLWMGYEGMAKLEKIHTFQSETPVSQICEYHSSLILSASDRLLVYESELKKMAQISDRVQAYSLKNRLACCYPDGTLRYAIVK